MHKNRAEIGYNCRMTEIIRLPTTKAVAVPKISSTVRDLYGQATLRNIQRGTCSRYSALTAWPLKTRSTGCRRSHFVYYYIINSVSTNYMEKSPFSTAKLLNPTINHLPFKESDDESLCSKRSIVKPLPGHFKSRLTPYLFTVYLNIMLSLTPRFLVLSGYPATTYMYFSTSLCMPHVCPFYHSCLHSRKTIRETVQTVSPSYDLLHRPVTPLPSTQ